MTLVHADESREHKAGASAPADLPIRTIQAIGVDQVNADGSVNRRGELTSRLKHVAGSDAVVSELMTSIARSLVHAEDGVLTLRIESQRDFDLLVAAQAAGALLSLERKKLLRETQPGIPQ